MKAEGHLDRCYLEGAAGDAANAILSAVGYNLRLVLAWLMMLLRLILLALQRALLSIPSSNQLVNGRLCKPSQEQRKPTGAGGCEVQKPL